MSQFAAAIFDLDGTLIDTESRFLEAGLTALAEFGQAVEREFLISLIGIGPDEGFRRLCAHLGIALDRVAFETAWTEAAREALAGVIPLQPGVAELLAELNTRQMEHLGRSRRELFEELDQPALKPLPEQAYEYAVWKKARNVRLR